MPTSPTPAASANSVPTSGSSHEIFDPNFLGRLEKLKLASRRLVSGAQKGEHRSRKRGSGIEFADYRPYIEGDSLRFVDWPAYLRFDKLLVRQFEEEGDLPVYLLVDCSESMATRVRSSQAAPTGKAAKLTKFDFARRVIAAIAYLGLDNLDRIIMAGFADGLTKRCPPLRGSRQIHRALDFLRSLETGAETNIELSVTQFFNEPRRRGLVVVVSDFLHEEGASPLTKLAGLRHDLLAVRVLDSRDLEPRLPRRAQVIDAETGNSVILEEQPDRNDVYRELVKDHADQVQSVCRRNAWSFVDANTDVPFDQVILDLLRAGHMRR